MTEPPPSALTYCLNVHPTQTWPDLRSALEGPAAAVKALVAPDVPFPVGLRISAEAAATLAQPAERAALAHVLAERDMRPITVNGFPYGRFHGAPVKEAVYQPDWRSEARVAYTVALAELMAAISPDGAIVSLSTSPGAFRAQAQDPADADRVADNYLRVAARLMAIEAETGRRVALAIEPEPACMFETTEELAAFFAARLFSPGGVRRLAALAGVSVAAAADAAPRHLGACHDVCHAALAFETPSQSVAALRAADVPMHKLQLSSALRVSHGDAASRAALARFDEPTYLHQLSARGPAGLTRFVDLPEALGPGGARDGEEWRVHFHVPVFLDRIAGLETTRDLLEETLALHRVEPLSPHLEVETYTWGVLPGEAPEGDLAAGVARELAWVAERLS